MLLPMADHVKFYLQMDEVANVTRFGNLLDFGQILKPLCNN